MTTGSSFERQLQTTLREVLDRASGPHPMWAESPAARDIAKRRRRGRLGRWPLRALAVAAVLVIGGAALVGALMREPRPPQFQHASNGWVVFAADGKAGPNLGSTDDGDNNPHTGGGALDSYLTAEGAPVRRIIGGDDENLERFAPAFSPDGSRLAFIERPYAANGGPTLVVTGLDRAGNLGTSIRINLTGLNADQTAFEWAPDGRSIAVGSASGLIVVSVDGGHTTPVPTETNQGPVGQPELGAFTWSPDASSIALIISRQLSGFEMWVASVDGRRMQRLLTMPANEDLQVLAWSPDGSTIAAIGQDFGTRVAGAELIADNRFVRLIGLARPTETTSEFSRWKVPIDGEGDIGKGSLAWSADGHFLAYLAGNRVFVGDPSMTRKTPHTLRLPDGVLAVNGFAWSPDGQRLLITGSAAPPLSGVDVPTTFSLWSVDPGAISPPVQLTPWSDAINRSGDMITWQPRPAVTAP